MSIEAARGATGQRERRAAVRTAASLTNLSTPPAACLACRLTDDQGFNCMWITTVSIIFPLCMLPNMRTLEPVGAVGSLIVW